MPKMVSAVRVVVAVLLVAVSVSGVQADGKPPASALPQPKNVGALGRIEPLHGVYQLQVPTGLFPARVHKLLVEEGDKVRQGDVVAFIDNMQTLPSEVEETRNTAASRRAEYEQARRDYLRFRALAEQGAVSEETFEQSEKKMKKAQDSLKAAGAAVRTRVVQLGRTAIIAPVDGTILKIHARDGESAPWNKGVLAMGMTDHMRAVAEVYESDIHRVRVGQRALVKSPALTAPLEGTVERIGMMVEPPHDFSPDPAENTESRIIKVRIRLDDSKPVERLTGLQVHVIIRAN